MRMHSWKRIWAGSQIRLSKTKCKLKKQYKTYRLTHRFCAEWNENWRKMKLKSSSFSTNWRCLLDKCNPRNRCGQPHRINYKKRNLVQQSVPLRIHKLRWGQKFNSRRSQSSNKWCGRTLKNHRSPISPLPGFSDLFSYLRLFFCIRTFVL